jgi:hypothetical protein
MTQTEVLNKIRNSNGKIFNVVFIKKDGTIRHMNCRIGVKKGVKGKGLSFDPLLKGLLPVFDMAKNAFRMINLETIQKLKIAGEEF